MDPDRFFDRTSPGAHEWWYFDALSGDGRDALVIVWYAGLPFDPSYGVATLRHLHNPGKYPKPRALDHSAIGLSWYRDGKPIAYALNGYKADQFRHSAEPFSVQVGKSRVERDGQGYRLEVVTSTVEGRPIVADFRFRPAEATEPFERDLGTAEAPHNWILAASDCRVEGSATIGDQTLTFAGRGYHDHNAGAEDLSIAMKRWEWGRVHHGSLTEIYYMSEPRQGDSQSLWITCRDGQPEEVREAVRFTDSRLQRNAFGLRHDRTLTLTQRASQLTRVNGARVDDGPFYQRWLADFSIETGQEPATGPGIAELLDTRNLHKPLFNWMIPYRLKWPRA